MDKVSVYKLLVCECVCSVVVCGRKKGDSEETRWGELLFTHHVVSSL